MRSVPCECSVTLPEVHLPLVQTLCLVPIIRCGFGGPQDHSQGLSWNLLPGPALQKPAPSPGLAAEIYGQWT